MPGGLTHLGQASGAQSGRRVMTGLMLMMCLVAFDSTVVAATLPSMVADLGGASVFAWVVSGYLVALASSSPVFGRAADAYGSRTVLFVGATLFIGGSLINALAPTMAILVLGRILQGLGGGAILPVVQIVIGERYPLEKRAGPQSKVASVWAVAGLTGPLGGGLVAEYATWRLVFLANLPLGLLALLLVARNLSAPSRPRDVRMNLAASVLVLVGSTAVLMILLHGGDVRDSWRSWPFWVLLLVAVTAFGVLACRRRSGGDNPFHTRGYATLCVIACVCGAVVTNIYSFMPTYLQRAVGASVVTAGLVIVAMSTGWPLGTFIAVRVQLRLGFRSTVLIGLVLMSVGTTAVGTLVGHGRIWQYSVALFLLGMGVGLASNSVLNAAQTATPPRLRGAAVGGIVFGRLMASAMAPALLSGLIYIPLSGAGDDPGMQSTAMAATMWVTWAIAVAGVVIAWFARTLGVLRPTSATVGSGAASAPAAAKDDSGA